MPTPLPVIANVFRCALNWLDSTTGQTAVNVIHILGTSSATSASVGEALDDAATTTMFGLQIPTASVTLIEITPLDGVSATLPYTPTIPANWTGSSSSTAFSPQTAEVIKLTTAVRGRANRGRIFLPFVDNNQNQDGHLTVGHVPSVTAAWQAFDAALLADSPIAYTLGVAAYDRAHGGAGAHFTGLLNIECEVEVATQRKRQERNR